MRTKLAVCHERAKRVDDDAGGEEGGNVRGVVRRETSTISIPQSPSFATLPTSPSASRGRKPPGSGHPVPGTNPQSTESMSKLI
jgi:hypothetical protein